MDKKSLKIGSVMLIMLFSFVGNYAYTFYDDVNDYVILNINKVNQDPDPAIAGDVFDLRISIENDGGSGEGDFIVEIEPSYPFEEVEGEDLIQDVGVINGYEDGNDAIIAKFKLRVSEDATEGDYPIEVHIYKKGEDASSGYTKEITVTVGNEESAEVSLDADELVSGDKTNVTFTIKNTGSAPIKNLEFSWESEDNAILPLGSGNLKTISYIGVGKSVDITYTVLASTDVNPGIYELTMNLNYDDSLNDTKEEVEHIAGILVLGKTDFEVSYSGEDSGEYTLTVMNVGKSDVNSVIVSIPEQDAWSVSGVSTSIIGNLDGGDYTFSNFELSTTNSNSPLIVEITYTSPEGDRVTIEKEVEMPSTTSVTSMSSDTSGTPEDFAGGPGGNMNPLSTIQNSITSAIPYVIGGLVALAAIAVFVYKIIKRKKSKQTKQTKTE
ncbi:COG1361 S-layer family protein [Methanococcus sp. CF]